MNRKSTRILSAMLAVAMVFGIVATILPSASAAETTASDELLVTITSKESTLAPGVTQTINSANRTADGNKVNYYVAIADLNNENVGIQATYMNAQCATSGMQKMTEQVAAMIQKHTNADDAENYIPNYAVVAAVNGDGYDNGSTGKPSGAMVMGGVYGFNYKDALNTPWFALFEDGTAACGLNNTDWNAAINAHGAVKEAIGGFQLLMKDGVVKKPGAEGGSTYWREGNWYPCSFVGVTPDNKVVLINCDGQGAGGSFGLDYSTTIELAQEMGLRDLLCLDGGGSATYLSRPEGEDEIQLISHPSDGAERSVGNGLLIYSTVPASNVFDHAVITPDSEYITPGGSIGFSAVGVSPANTAADIPADATYQAVNGSIVDGKFVSDGTAGEAKIQMVSGGKVVGEAIIHVVVPDTLSFAQTNITVPYDRTVLLEVAAKYGVNEVALSAGAVRFELSNPAMGTVNGNAFTATSDTSIKSGDITAVLACDNSVVATATVTYGRGSEIVYDFEEGESSIANITLSYKSPYNPSNSSYFFSDEFGVVTAETGKVRNGKYALRIHSHSNSTTVMNWLQTRYNGWNIDLTDAVSLSFWIYIPEGAHGYEFDFGSNVVPVVLLGQEFVTGTGWQYFTVPVSALGGTKMDQIRLYRSDNDYTGTNYVALEHPNYYADATFYLDDITVNYSSAVDDNHAPVIEDVRLVRLTNETPIALNGQTINEGTISIIANIADSTEYSMPVGLDTSSVIVYVDGMKVEAECSDTGMVSTDYISLANGAHTVRIEAADKNGNTTYVEKSIVVAEEGNTKNTVVYAPADATLKNLPTGSVYWMDLTATAIEKVEKLEMLIDLDLNSDWELDHMELAVGFEAVYSVNKETNDASITITRTGEVELTGEAVIAKLPIRTWIPEFIQGDGGEDVDSYRLVAVESYVEKGLLTETDGNKVPFGSPKYSTVTEFNNTRPNSAGDMPPVHKHVNGEAQSKDATCTEAGYEGRIFCVGCSCATTCHHGGSCGSVVEWGTTIPATGHTFKIVDGVLKCGCGKIFNGEKDGVLYVDGVPFDGWKDESYYAEGVKVTGICLIDGYYYDFGENGVCEDKIKYTGLYNDGTDLYQIELGVKKAGWYSDGTDFYYFDEETFKGIKEGRHTVKSGRSYEFENYVLIDGHWQLSDIGTPFLMWGDEPVANGWKVIKGNTYYFWHGRAYTGLELVRENWADKAPLMYSFDDNGVCQGLYTGFCTYNDVYRYYVDGVRQYGLGLFEVDGDKYYVNSQGVVATGEKFLYDYWVEYQLETGTYIFAEDGKLIGLKAKNGFFEEDGKLAYYVNNKKQYGLALFEVDGETYYMNSKGEVATGEKFLYDYWVEYKLETGTYIFAEDGKLIGLKAKNGFITEDDGTLGYYVNNKKQYGLALFEVDGETYYMNSKGVVATGEKFLYDYWVEYKLETGTYIFAEDGKLIGLKAEN